MRHNRAARLRFAPAAVDVMPLAGDGMVLRSPQPLGPYARCLGELIVHWAEQIPDRVFVAERDGRGGWRTVIYAQGLTQVRSTAQGLLDRGLSAERPVAVLSDNSLDHVRLALAAMHVGVPVAPVSPSYSLVSQDHAKLRHIMGQLCPGLIYAADGDRFAKALAAIDLKGAEVVTASTFDALAAPPTEAVDRAFQAVRPDTVAKTLFTSGSTGPPKGVLNTHAAPAPLDTAGGAFDRGPRAPGAVRIVLGRDRDRAGDHHRAFRRRARRRRRPAGAGGAAEDAAQRRQAGDAG